jgi:hypothetical protein
VTEILDLAMPFLGLILLGAPASAVSIPLIVYAIRPGLPC